MSGRASRLCSSGGSQVGHAPERLPASEVFDFREGVLIAPNCGLNWTQKRPRYSWKSRPSASQRKMRQGDQFANVESLFLFWAAERQLIEKALSYGA